MFGWFRSKGQEAAFPEDHVILAKIAGLVRGSITDKLIFSNVARPNCAIVLDERGDVSLRWISESDNVSDVISFALLGQLSTYRELLEMCMQEIKVGTFDDTFLGGPGLILFYRVAIEALNEMKRACEPIEK